MELIPRPDLPGSAFVVSAAGNVAHKVLYGGLADLRPMPRTLIDDGMLREVYHYRPSAKVVEQGDPVLLVTPLAAPALCFDLRRGCSLVEHFVSNGRPTYLVEYGQVSFRDRNLGMEHWIDEVVPAAIREVSAARRRTTRARGRLEPGRGVRAAHRGRQPDLPIASVTAVGSPFDIKQVPLVAPLRPLLNLTEGGGIINRSYQAMGGAPKPLVKWAFQLSSFQKLVTKPLAVATRLDDQDFLAQLEAVDRFMDNMIAYPGRTFGQLYHRFVRGNALVTGSIDFGDRTISVADITAPVLVFGGATDGIAPIPAVRTVVPLLTGSKEVRFEVVPGGHLGHADRTAGPAARPGRSWTSGSASGPRTPRRPRLRGPARRPPRRRPPRKAAAKKAPAKKAPAKKSATKKSAAKTTGAKKPRTAASRDAIGTNPARRYGSAGSRSLSS